MCLLILIIYLTSSDLKPYNRSLRGMLKCLVFVNQLFIPDLSDYPSLIPYPSSKSNAVTKIFSSPSLHHIIISFTECPFLFIIFSLISLVSVTNPTFHFSPNLLTHILPSSCTAQSSDQPLVQSTDKLQTTWLNILLGMTHFSSGKSHPKNHFSLKPTK